VGVTGRGHTVRAVADAFVLSKDAGFKVISHMMPDLPNHGMERDLQGVSLPVSLPVSLLCCMGRVVRNTVTPGLY